MEWFIALSALGFFAVCYLADANNTLHMQLRVARQQYCALSRGNLNLQKENDCLRHEVSVAEEHIATLTDSSACPSCQQQGAIQWHEQKPAENQNQRAYYEQLVNEVNEIRATMTGKQYVN
jgi:cell division protein FtsB